MKVTRLDSEGLPPKLWKFFEKNLPSSLKAVRLDDGYGSIYGIEAFNKRRSLTSMMFPRGNGIATIYFDNKVELRVPEYYSDFEDIIIKYEAETKKEVEFLYWEAS